MGNNTGHLGTGHAHKIATATRPKTCRAALTSLQIRAIRYFCETCKAMGGCVCDVVDIQDNTRSYSADCILECGHQKVITIAVREKDWLATKEETNGR